jgi:hypothetical protein
VISPLAQAWLPVAVRAPGAAATAAEADKRTTYGDAAKAANIELVPFVLDAFGGLSDSALEFLKPLTKRTRHVSA